MPYQVNDYVVHPAHGVGQIVALAMQRFFDVEARLYYEIVIQRNTVWVPVDTSVASGLRPVTSKSELARYRRVLRSQPVSLATDHRQRHQDLVNLLKAGLFQNACEVARDLTARRWLKPLNEWDSTTLRKTRDDLCREWAAAGGMSVPEAMQEIDALLLEGRQAYQV
jgi:CarD family transcriptional regulator